MPHESTHVPPDLRSRLECARLDTLALLRAIDQAYIPPDRLPETALHQLYELDADCAEALWALDQPPRSLDIKAMVRDTLASLTKLPKARDLLLRRLRSFPRVSQLEPIIRVALDPAEAYNDVPGHPQVR